MMKYYKYTIHTKIQEIYRVHPGEKYWEYLKLDERCGPRKWRDKDFEAGEPLRPWHSVINGHWFGEIEEITKEEAFKILL